jgi:hypothetical protein
MSTRLRTAVLSAFVGLALLAAPARAQEASPVPAVAFLAPDTAVDGVDLVDWSVRSWQWLFSFPASVNPSTDATGERCTYGQSGPVFFLVAAEASGERVCTIPSGVHVFVPLGGAECSTVEEPPFHGDSDAELVACAQDATAHMPPAAIADMDLTVDGQSVGDLAPYHRTTSAFDLLLPADNVLGVAPGVARAAADGYQVLLAPLAAGDHTVVVSVPGPEGLVVTTYRLTVASGAPAGSATPTS